MLSLSCVMDLHSTDGGGNVSSSVKAFAFLNTDLLRGFEALPAVCLRVDEALLAVCLRVGEATNLFLVIELDFRRGFGFGLGTGRGLALITAVVAVSFSVDFPLIRGAGMGRILELERP